MQEKPISSALLRSQGFEFVLPACLAVPAHKPHRRRIVVPSVSFERNAILFLSRHRVHAVVESHTSMANPVLRICHAWDVRMQLPNHSQSVPRRVANSRVMASVSRISIRPRCPPWPCSWWVPGYLKANVPFSGPSAACS
jgi:hypothetical protein